MKKLAYLLGKEPMANTEEIQKWSNDDVLLLKSINDYLNHYVAITDTKSGALAIMATITLTLTGNFMRESMSSSEQWALKAAVCMHLATFIACGFVVFPRKPSRGDSVVFWEDVSLCKNVGDYQEKVKLALDSGFMGLEYAAQNFYVSKVLSKKNKALRRAFITYAITGVTVLVLLWWPL